MKTQNFRILLMLIALSLLTGLSAHADEVTPSFITEACFTKPQSPDAWAMTRYGEASLDLFHGTIGLTVPVYTYRDKDFTIPVSLSYASTGFMPSRSNSTPKAPKKAALARVDRGVARSVMEWGAAEMCAPTALWG